MHVGYAFHVFEADAAILIFLACPDVCMLCVPLLGCIFLAAMSLLGCTDGGRHVNLENADKNGGPTIAASYFNHMVFAESACDTTAS